MTDEHFVDRFPAATRTWMAGSFRPSIVAAIFCMTQRMRDPTRFDAVSEASGVSSPAAPGFGEGADQEYPDEEATYGRAVSLLLSGTFTSPPEPVRLSELRKERGISQTELAELLNQQQGEVSKIERRKDVKLSTLRDYVKSIGGTLQRLARLSNGVVRVIELEEEQDQASRRGSPAAGKSA